VKSHDCAPPPATRPRERRSAPERGPDARELPRGLHFHFHFRSAQRKSEVRRRTWPPRAKRTRVRQFAAKERPRRRFQHRIPRWQRVVERAAQVPQKQMMQPFLAQPRAAGATRARVMLAWRHAKAGATRAPCAPLASSSAAPRRKQEPMRPKGPIRPRSRWQAVKKKVVPERRGASAAEEEEEGRRARCARASRLLLQLAAPVMGQVQVQVSAPLRAMEATMMEKPCAPPASYVPPRSSAAASRCHSAVRETATRVGRNRTPTCPCALVQRPPHRPEHSRPTRAARSAYGVPPRAPVVPGR